MGQSTVCLIHFSIPSSYHSGWNVAGAKQAFALRDLFLNSYSYSYFNFCSQTIFIGGKLGSKNRNTNQEWRKERGEHFRGLHGLKFKQNYNSFHNSNPFPKTIQNTLPLNNKAVSKAKNL